MQSTPPLTNKGHDVAKAESVRGQSSQVVEILVLQLAVLEAQAEVLRRRLPLVLRRRGLTFAGEEERESGKATITDHETLPRRGKSGGREVEAKGRRGLTRRRSPPRAGTASRKAAAGRRTPPSRLSLYRRPLGLESEMEWR